MTEIWRECTLHSGYEVSNLGNIRSITRETSCKNKNDLNVVFKVKGRLIRPYGNGLGYIRVRLGKKHHYVHRLVALAFIANSLGKPEVNHKNGVRFDNRVDNLEWATRSENIKHSFAELGRESKLSGNVLSGKDHPKSKPVIRICKKTGEEFSYDSATEAVKDGFIGPSISRACNGVGRSHKGFYWRFA